MRLANLLSVTDSVAIPRRDAGNDVTSVDIDPRSKPEICEDILQLSYCKLPIPDVAALVVAEDVCPLILEISFCYSGSSQLDVEDAINIGPTYP